MFLNADEERLMIKRDMKNCLDFSFVKGCEYGEWEKTIEIARKMEQNGLGSNCIAKMRFVGTRNIRIIKYLNISLIQQIIFKPINKHNK